MTWNSAGRSVFSPTDAASLPPSSSTWFPSASSAPRAANRGTVYWTQRIQFRRPRTISQQSTSCDRIGWGAGIIRFTNKPYGSARSARARTAGGCGQLRRPTPAWARWQRPRVGRCAVDVEGCQSFYVLHAGDGSTVHLWLTMVRHTTAFSKTTDVLPSNIDQRQGRHQTAERQPQLDHARPWMTEYGNTSILLSAVPLHVGGFSPSLQNLSHPRFVPELANER